MQVPYAHFLGGRDTTWEPKGSKRVVVAKSHSGQTAYRFATLLVLVAFRAPDKNKPFNGHERFAHPLWPVR